MLPPKGPRPHPYYEIPDGYLDVRFADTSGKHRTVRVRQKTLGAGPPLVLVHGLMNSSYGWRNVLAPLAERYTVFAPDLVGCGRTDKPTDMAYTLANVARFVVAYVRAVTTPPVYVVGNSLGGLTALRAILGDEALARRFVLMHAPGYPMWKTRLLAGAFAVPGVAALCESVSHAWPRFFVSKNVHYAHDGVLSEEECAEHGRPFEDRDGARVFARILAESLDPKEQGEVIEDLRRRKEAGIAFPCPVKILYAKEDALVPPELGPLYQADLPGSELVWIEDSSHFLQVEAPERTVSEIVSFDAEAPERAA